MPTTEKVIKGLEVCTSIADDESCPNDCPYYQGMCSGYNKLMRDALALLKKQEESIPISWLKEKLEGHPELSYAVTDGIINVLNLWEGR